MTITFSISPALDDEYWLEMFVDGEYVGQIDYYSSEFEDPALLTVWRLYVEEGQRGQGVLPPHA